MQPLQRRRTASDLPGLDLAEQKSWQSFVEASLRLNAAVSRWLADAHDLSAMDLRVLSVLLKAPTGFVRMGDLAKEVGLLPGHLTKRVQRLEERRLVRREKYPHDRRVVMAAITDEGRTIAAKAAMTIARGVRADLGGSLSSAMVSIIEKNCGRISAQFKSAR